MTQTDTILARARRHASETAVEVDLDRVDWDISERARRRAGACKWDPGRERATIVLARRAIEAFDWSELAAVVRHELVHVWEYQQHGNSGHGSRFRRKAAEIDAPRHCPSFTNPRYRLHCSECDWQTRRHRASAPIKRPERYGCGSCSGPIVVEHTESGRSWTDGGGYQSTRADLGDAW